MADTEPKLPWKRAYTFTGKVAHIVPTEAGNDSLAGGFGRSLCGMEPPTWAPWFGTGNQQEIDKVNQMELCRVCTNNAYVNKFDLEHKN